MNPDGAADGLELETRAIGGGIARLDLGGTLDWSNYHRVDAELQRLFAERTYRIVVNLARVRLITSAGFGSFIGALDTALKNHGNIVFVNVPRDIQDVFQVLGLSRILTFAESEQEAIGKFSPRPPRAGAGSS